MAIQRNRYLKKRAIRVKETRKIIRINALTISIESLRWWNMWFDNTTYIKASQFLADAGINNVEISASGPMLAIRVCNSVGYGCIKLYKYSYITGYIPDRNITYKEMFAAYPTETASTKPSITLTDTALAVSDTGQYVATEVFIEGKLYVYVYRWDALQYGYTVTHMLSVDHLGLGQSIGELTLEFIASKTSVFIKTNTILKITMPDTGAQTGIQME